MNAHMEMYAWQGHMCQHRCSLLSKVVVKRALFKETTQPKVTSSSHVESPSLREVFRLFKAIGNREAFREVSFFMTEALKIQGGRQFAMSVHSWLKEHGLPEALLDFSLRS